MHVTSAFSSPSSSSTDAVDAPSPSSSRLPPPLRVPALPLLRSSYGKEEVVRVSFILSKRVAVASRRRPPPCPTHWAPHPHLPPPSSSRACSRLAVAALFIPKRRRQRRFHLDQTCCRRRLPPSSSLPNAVDTPSPSSPTVLLSRVYPPCRGRALRTEKKSRWSALVLVSS